MEAKIKTIKKWEASGLKWNDYFKVGDRINKSTFLYIGEVNCAEYVDENYVQMGEAEFSKYVGVDKVYFHTTAFRGADGKYYYLGALPSFNQIPLKP